MIWNIKIKGWDLSYFGTGEWQVVKERLDDQDTDFCPGASNLFASLRAVPFDRVRVAIMGQDPYPQRMYCTGLAFSTPAGITPYPASLVNIFREYSADLGFPTPRCGDLGPWCEQGVLLWNVYPSCAIGSPGSHHWPEWEYLTKELVEKLDERDVIFILLGTRARYFKQYINQSDTIATSHPSPLGANKGFIGSRIFSRTNALLSNKGKEGINWKLE